MKSLLISAMVMLSATTASAFDYVVTGNAAPEMEGKMFYLLDDNSNLVDSTKVAAGKFKFQGNADKAYYGRIGFKENIDGGVRTNYIAELIVEPGTVEMDMNKRMPAKGGELNTKFASLWGGVMAKQDAVMKQLEALQKDSLDQETMMQKRNEIVSAFYQDFGATVKNAILENKDNAVGVSALRQYSQLCTPEEWQEVYAVVSPDIKNLDFVKEQNNKVNNILRTSVGKKFIDVEGKNIDGTVAHLSDYVGKGKYVLVDYWASWCGPCRREAKETLIPLYEKYKGDDRFTILGVATWDEADETKKAINRLGYKWPQIIDAGTAPSDTYGFSGIPMIMLFGPDGTILARDIRGEEIVNKVAECLK